ncbi:ABC transporter permease [Paenibacillus polymyxa]|uniref:ABC transporter permease n=1 Tax=Paenibacillus polymyxa TaxID=1406 RepID=UPI003217E92B
MKVFWALVKNNLRISVLRKPISFIILTILPIIVLVAASTLITYSAIYINVGVLDLDNSRISNVVGGILEEANGIKVYKLDRKEDIASKFRDNTINIAVEINKGFDEGIINGTIQDIKVYANKGSNDYMLVSSLLKNHILNFRNLGRATEGDPQKLYHAVEEYMKNSSIVSNEPLNDLYADYNNSKLFIGFLIMIIFFKSSSVANSINLDKGNNVYSRVFAAGVKSWQYHGANIVCNLLIVFFQLAIAILAMQYLTHTSVGVPPTTLLLILIIISVVAVSFGTLVVTCTKSTEAASMASNLITLVFVLLGGSFIEAEYFPGFINIISYISPARWAIACMQALQEGAMVRDIYPMIAIMVVIASIFLYVAFYIAARKDKQFKAI